MIVDLIDTKQKGKLFKNFFSLYIYKNSYRKFQFGSKLKVDGAELPNYYLKG